MSTVSGRIQESQTPFDDISMHNNLLMIIQLVILLSHKSYKRTLSIFEKVIGDCPTLDCKSEKGATKSNVSILSYQVTRYA